MVPSLQLIETATSLAYSPRTVVGCYANRMEDPAIMRTVQNIVMRRVLGAQPVLRPAKNTSALQSKNQEK